MDPWFLDPDDVREEGEGEEEQAGTSATEEEDCERMTQAHIDEFKILLPRPQETQPGEKSVSEILMDLDCHNQQFIISQLTANSVMNFLHRERESPVAARITVFMLELLEPASDHQWLPLLLYALRFIRNATYGEDIAISHALWAYAYAISGQASLQFRDGAVICMKRIAALIPDVVVDVPPVAYILYSAFSWLRRGSPVEAGKLLLTFIAHQGVIRVPKLITKIFVDYFHDNHTVGPILHLLLNGYVDRKVIFTEDFPLTRAVCPFIAGACVGIGENQPEPNMKHAYSLLRLVHRLSLVLERDGEEWRMMNGAMGLRDFWEAMINAGYDPREFSPIRHPGNHLLRDSCPWPFGDIEGDFPPMNVFPIMRALTTRATWKTGGTFIDGCAEYSVVGGSSTLMNKFRRSFASVLVQIVCRQYRDISLLGALDPRVCVAVGFDPGRFHVEVRAEVRSLMRMPHIFTEIDKWRVISPRLAQISIWSPLITLYRSRGSCAGEGEEIKLPEFSVDFRNRRLSCNVESVKWQDHSSRPFICLNGVVRIGSFPGIMVAGKEGSMEDRVHNSLRTAIIGSLSVDAIDSAQPESAVNCFIRLHRNFIDSDIRMFAAVVQGAKHPFIAFRCEGHFLNNPWVNNIVEPPNTYVVQLNDNVDDIWHVIQAFRSESAFMRYVVRDSPRQFIEVFLQGVMMLLTGGRVLSMETLSSENEKYLAHLGWICAYILIRRVSFANFGPDVPIEEDFMTEILSRGHYRGKHPRKQEIFGEGFDLILTMRMMTSLVSLKELWQIMRKCS